MTGRPTVDLDDSDFDTMLSTPVTAEEIKRASDAPSMQAPQAAGSLASAHFVEACNACHGSGRFRSYAGRDCGPCFKCKGAGKKAYKQPAATRAKNRANTAARKERNADSNWDAFKAAHADLAAWIVAKESTFGFAASMRQAVRDFGGLTEGQELGVLKCMARDVEREEAKRAKAIESAAKVEAAPTVDLTRIAAAFERARGAGLKRLKLHLGGLMIKPAKEGSRNAGGLYVFRGRGESRTYLGKIIEGKFLASRDCTAEESARLIEAAADPEKAAKAHGVATGTCSCCGAELTNKESIEAGIGPICASKWF